MFDYDIEMLTYLTKTSIYFGGATDKTNYCSKINSFEISVVAAELSAINGKK